MRSVVTKKKVYIYLADNFAIVYPKTRVKINDKVVFWQSPLLPVPTPVPISKK